jgi:hypothetical protein
MIKNPKSIVFAVGSKPFYYLTVSSKDQAITLDMFMLALEYSCNKHKP